jgi:hypothetical protein
LRVIGVRQSGVLELVGRCGTVITKHPTSCALCHLPNIDPTIDTQLARPVENMPCSVCGDPSQPARMLMCDGCNSGWHLHCLTPPLTSVPRGLWFCPACHLLDPEMHAAPAPAPVTTPTPAKRPSPLVEALGQWDGRSIQRSKRGQGQHDIGKVRFLGTGEGTRCYEATFADGSTQRFTHGAVESLLLPTDGPRLAAVIACSDPAQLPSKWLLDTYEHARRCLTSLAPGHWTEGHITGLLMQANMFSASPALCYHPANLQACVTHLARAVSLPPAVRNLWDSGSAGLRDALGALGTTLQPASPDLLAPLYPAFYERVPGGVHNTFFVGSPSGHVCDMILLLCALFAPPMMAVLVPSTYHTHAPTARSAALGKLGSSGRVCVLPCPSELEGANQLVQSAWIVVFKDTATKARLLSSNAPIFDLATVA